MFLLEASSDSESGDSDGEVELHPLLQAHRRPVKTEAKPTPPTPPTTDSSITADKGRRPTKDQNSSKCQTYDEHQRPDEGPSLKEGQMFELPIGPMPEPVYELPIGPMPEPSHNILIGPMPKPNDVDSLQKATNQTTDAAKVYMERKYSTKVEEEKGIEQGDDDTEEEKDDDQSEKEDDNWADNLEEGPIEYGPNMEYDMSKWMAEFGLTAGRY